MQAAGRAKRLLEGRVAPVFPGAGFAPTAVASHARLAEVGSLVPEDIQFLYQFCVRMVSARQLIYMLR